jgi:hypothetical protein
VGGFFFISLGLEIVIGQVTRWLFFSLFLLKGMFSGRKKEEFSRFWMFLILDFEDRLRSASFFLGENSNK